MAIETGGLTQQSSLRINRGSLRSLRQDIASKGGAGIGPEAVQAFAEGELEADVRLKAEQSRQALTAKLERERIAESTRQFNVQAGEARKQRKAQEGNFFTGLFGS